MKGTLKLEDGREVTVEIDENTLKSIEEPKNTGYERVERYGIYYYLLPNGIIKFDNDERHYVDNEFYDYANYYSDRTVAGNNARADTLMRRLRRFAVEHRTKELDWEHNNQKKWAIVYRHDMNNVVADYNIQYHGFGEIYFDTKETAEAAIEEFKDELIWYFTEYRDSL